jgi:hypothetical protein
MKSIRGAIPHFHSMETVCLCDIYVPYYALIGQTCAWYLRRMKQSVDSNISTNLQAQSYD